MLSLYCETVLYGRARYTIECARRGYGLCFLPKIVGNSGGQTFSKYPLLLDLIVAPNHHYKIALHCESLHHYPRVWSIAILKVWLIIVSQTTLLLRVQHDSTREMCIISIVDVQGTK